MEIRYPQGRRSLRINLVPVAASWERVIRTTVGLRPHRPSGFLLKAERLDDKMLIHDYGHGGAGHGIGWGTRGSGGRAGDAADEPAGRGHRLRDGGSDRGAAAPAPWLRRHDLRRVTAAGHHVEHGHGVLLAGVRADFCRANSGVGHPVPARRRDRLPRAPASGRVSIRHLVDRQLHDERRAPAAAPREEPGTGELVPRSMQTDRIVLGPGSIRFRRPTRCGAPSCESNRPSISTRCSPTSCSLAAVSSCASSRRRAT